MADDTTHIESTKRPTQAAEEHHGLLGNIWSGCTDLLQASAYSAIEKPADGLVQWANHSVSAVNPATKFHLGNLNLVSAPEHANGWTWVGSKAGDVVDFYLLSKGVGKARQSLTGISQSVPLLEAGVTGAAYQLAMPVDENADFAGAKWRGAATSFVTFATMDGTARGISKLATPASKMEAASSLQRLQMAGKKIGIATIAGGVGGLSNSLVDASLNHKSLEGRQVLSNIGSYAAFGAMFESLNAGPGLAKGLGENYAAARMRAGKPLFTVGPVEINPKGFAAKSNELVRTDALTQLPNGIAGREVLSAETARAQRSGQPLTVTYMDVDGFGQVNKSFGHEVGDHLIKAVAGAVKGQYHRGADVVVRDHGDELMAITPDTPMADATKLASKVEAEARFGVSNKPPTASDFARSFTSELQKLQGLGRTVSLEGTQSVESLAENLIKQRMAITGEKFTPETVNAEVERLSQKPGMASGFAGPGEVTVYDQQDMAALAKNTSFRFLPKIGQVLVSKGIATEQQIEDAFAYQKTFPKGQEPLLGKILTDRGIATEAQVRSAFEQQNESRNLINSIIEQSTRAPAPLPVIGPQQFQRQSMPELDVIAIGFRTDIPVGNPVMAPRLSATGVRLLWPSERTIGKEQLVTVSTGVAELKQASAPNDVSGARLVESADELKRRADARMRANKVLRKATAGT